MGVTRLQHFQERMFEETKPWSTAGEKATHVISRAQETRSPERDTKEGWENEEQGQLALSPPELREQQRDSGDASN